MVASSIRFAGLERLNIFSLQALGAFGDVEFHRLALLQASEAACLNRREVYKNIFPALAANESITLAVVKPLYCSLFCHVNVPFQDLRWRDSEV
jgi:hypothetical protein